jgi:K+-sensing histidine kinase KdpD
MRLSTRKHQVVVETGCAGLLVFLAWIDYVTGYEFGFFIFYFLPVSIAAWYVGRRSGLTFAVLSAIAWYLSDRLTHHPYSNALLIYWETFMRLVSFLTTALTLSQIKVLASSESRLHDLLRIANEEIANLRRDLGQHEASVDNSSSQTAERSSPIRRAEPPA